MVVEDNFTNLFAKLSLSPIIPVVNMNYKFQPIFVNDVARAILKSIETKNNEGQIYEVGGEKGHQFWRYGKINPKNNWKKKISCRNANDTC